MRDLNLALFTKGYAYGYQVLGELCFKYNKSVIDNEIETEFDEKILPWHLLENSPARQNFWIDDGALHITILRPEGAYGERSDLALCCRNLNFKKGQQ